MTRKLNNREKILLGAEGKVVQVSDYQKGDYFVWYKANTRISELVRWGLMVKVDQDKFAHYSTTPLGDLFIGAIKRGETMKRTKGEFMIVWKDGETKGVVDTSMIKKLFTFFK